MLWLGGAETRRSHPGSSEFHHFWPTFDVSEVDTTNFPDIDCRYRHYRSGCDHWQRVPNFGISGVHSDGSSKLWYVNVKAPPGGEVDDEAVKDEFKRRFPRHDRQYVIIPVKYDYEELWRWSVILDRFAPSAGNTLGITAAWIGLNSVTTEKYSWGSCVSSGRSRRGIRQSG